VVGGNGVPGPLDALRALPEDVPRVLLHGGPGGRAVLVWAPDRVVGGRLAPRGPEEGGCGVRPRRPSETAPLGGPDPFGALELALHAADWDDPEHDLGPAWFGWFGWTCGHAVESFPWGADPPGEADWPHWWFGRFPRALVWDGAGGCRLRLALPAVERPPAVATPAAELARASALLERAARLAPAAVELEPLRPVVTADAYRAGVAALRATIREGGLFQANLTHLLVGGFRGAAADLHARLAAAQPTAHGAFWSDGRGRALSSQSPERFLAVAGERLETRPIKGTARRGADPTEDARLRDALEASTKERAELAMVVDMARNDLGRVAVPGGVTLVHPGEVETFPTLHHRTATVRAVWDPSRGVAALLAATFPPASVSGAPKVAALRRVAELERFDRGAYCGALGWLRRGGERLDGDLAVLIRTLRLSGGTARMGVGAGIVWDSEPDAEWRETLLKARYLDAAAAPANLGASPWTPPSPSSRPTCRSTATSPSPSTRSSPSGGTARRRP